MSEQTYLHTTQPELQKLYAACESIHTALNTVSNESFGVESFFTTIKATPSKLVAMFKDAFRFMKTWDYSRPVVLNDKQLYRVLKLHPYTDVMDFIVHTPVGFTGNLHRYTEELKDVQLVSITKVVLDVLKSVRSELGYFLDVDNMGDRRVDTPNPKHLDELRELESKWVSTERTTEATYSQLFDNNKECYLAMANINYINSVRWRELPPKKMESEVKDLQELAEAVLTALQDTTKTVSPQVVGGITAQLEHAAKWVEWYSAMTTRIIDLTTAMKLNETKLLRAL